ncbi:hypothetical protein [Pseudomonas sp. Marseille-Q5115]|uniref:hypothetical protein n=1 Tax=Pseudomonas sp. Marseille-Q5115 TaxID=2866593 RepID=UPI001CE42FB7|nr:hypothetical protein [Pseudomonas sp. Marseille-Q5115]
MMPAWSLDKRLYGTDQPAQARTHVTVGPVGFWAEGPQLRHLTFGGIEVLRAVGLVIRDAWWGSHVVEAQAWNVQASETQWRGDLSGAVPGPDGSAALGWQLVVQVGQQGLVATARLIAQADFTTCRAGLMLLNPLAGVVGAPVAVTHGNGELEEGRFPDLISPGQPFLDIRELRHAPAPGLRAHWRLSGDTFEMEDQRNWGDASFKTYNRPLAWPCPYVIEAGSCVEQQVVLTLSREVAA